MSKACKHENGTAGYDIWRCSDCGSIKTDSGWGFASNRFFNSRDEAVFYRKNGRLPDDLTAHQQANRRGDGEA